MANKQHILDNPNKYEKFAWMVANMGHCSDAEDAITTVNRLNQEARKLLGESEKKFIGSIDLLDNGYNEYDY